MMTEEQNKEDYEAHEQSGEDTASLPSRLDRHGTRKKQKKQEASHENETHEENHATLIKDYNKSPMIARTLLSMFIVLVAIIFWFAFIA